MDFAHLLCLSPADGSPRAALCMVGLALEACSSTSDVGQDQRRQDQGVEPSVGRERVAADDTNSFVRTRIYYRSMVTTSCNGATVISL